MGGIVWNALTSKHGGRKWQNAWAQPVQWQQKKILRLQEQQRQEQNQG